MERVDLPPELNCGAAGTDQRGTDYYRPDNGETTCDIGAYEYQDPDTTAPTTTISLNPAQRNGQNGW